MPRIFNWFHHLSRLCKVAYSWMVLLMGRGVSKGLIRSAKTPFMAMYMSEHEKGTPRPCVDYHISFKYTRKKIHVSACQFCFRQNTLVSGNIHF